MPDSRPKPLHVSLVAVHGALMWPVSGLYEVLNSFSQMGELLGESPEGPSGDSPGEPRNPPPFQVEIIGSSRSFQQTVSGLSLRCDRTFDELTASDVIIVPSMFVEANGWTPGRYPEVVDWLSSMHARGTQLCSACSGALLLGETGLLDGGEATIHWAFASTFRRNFPNVHLRLEEVLVLAGRHREIIMSGATAGWHDLVLYLVAIHVGPDVAQTIARMMLLQPHPEGQAPYLSFIEPLEHGDREILELQRWLRRNYAQPSPVDAMQRCSSLPVGSFKRRFRRATGQSPLEYVQGLRVEQAKRQLERSSVPVDEIGVAVGYDNPAFFRRLFKRLTGITPSAYRRKFQLPAPAQAAERTAVAAGS